MTAAIDTFLRYKSSESPSLFSRAAALIKIERGDRILASRSTDRISHKSKWLVDLGEFDLVIHAAAITRLRTDASPADFIQANTNGTENLLNALSKKPPKLLVHLSTASIYGEIQDSKVDELTPLRAPDFYGTTKYVAELLCANSLFPSITVRLPGVVGPGCFVP